VITEKRLEEALKFLAETDEQQAKGSANVKYTYKAAIDELFEAEVSSSTLDNKRDKEALVIDLFRTLEASRRKNNI
jgi:hypothetical protein